MVLDCYNDGAGEMTGQNMPCCCAQHISRVTDTERAERIVTLRAGDSVTSLETPEGYFTHIQCSSCAV